jgi:hypothetical protein
VNFDRREEVMQILVDSPHKILEALHIALGYLGLGMLDECFTAIEVAIEDHGLIMLSSLRMC